MFAIKALKRTPAENVADLRKKGSIPAVFYGMKKPATSISISNIEFKKIWHKAGESSTVSITTPDGQIDALIHEVQVDPVSDEPIHVDFLAIDMNKKIKVNIGLVFDGVSGAVKSGVGTLVKVLHEVEVEALPKDLPQSFTIDISKLATLADQITVSDIKVPAGVTIINAPDAIVASVAEQKEEVEEAAAPVDLSAIEVSEKKGKKEEEGAEGAAPEAAEKK